MVTKIYSFLKSLKEFMQNHYNKNLLLYILSGLIIQPIFLRYSNIGTSLWTVITDYFYIFRQWTSLSSIYQTFVLDRYQNSSCIWLTRKTSRAFQRGIFIRFSSRRMIEEVRKKGRIYNNKSFFKNVPS